MVDSPELLAKYFYTVCEQIILLNTAFIITVLLHIFWYAEFCECF